jgi:hypothetical protein
VAPSASAEQPLQEEVVGRKTIEPAPAPSPGARGKVRAREDHRAIEPAFEFSKAVLLEENRFKTGSRELKLSVSVLLHVAVITLPIFVGLFFTDTINIKQYALAMLVAPPPPPPRPAATAILKAAPSRARFITAGKLFAPTVIPRQIAEVKEAPTEPESFGGGVQGGVPGGVPGEMAGVTGGVPGGVLSTAAKPVAPAPLKPGAASRRGACKTPQGHCSTASGISALGPAGSHSRTGAG